MKTYEIEHVFDEENTISALVSMLTGLSIEEVKPHVDKQRMRGNEFRKLFQKLGYNTNNRFIKFDPSTEYPCLIKCPKKGEESKTWYAFVYHQNKVYWPNVDHIDSLDDFIAWNDDIRITSMLQVWI